METCRIFEEKKALKCDKLHTHAIFQFRNTEYANSQSYSRVIFGPPVTTESRGRFESGFGYFEVFFKKLSPYAPRKSVGQT